MSIDRFVKICYTYRVRLKTAYNINNEREDMKKIFLPDYFFRSFADLNIDFLKKNSIEAIILDIDNTLVPYEIPKPTDELLFWFDELKNAGIKVAFVSNNNSERVNTFDEELGILIESD